jgi:hypothetical protein
MRARGTGVARDAIDARDAMTDATATARLPVPTTPLLRRVARSTRCAGDSRAR